MFSSAKCGAVLGALITLTLAGCGGDGDITTEATPSPEQQVERAGNKWAPLFATNDASTCRYMTQPACEREECERVGTGPIKNCTPPSAAYRGSFKEATVQDIAIKGDTAAAKFSNGEVVELVQGVGPAAWGISKFGGNAGRQFFE
ncbi:MAG: hypothetical protein ACRDP6_09670 [Actinoallomurus sp.]